MTSSCANLVTVIIEIHHRNQRQMGDWFFPFLSREESTQTLADPRCSILIWEMEVLKRQLNSVKEALTKSKGKNRKLKRKGELGVLLLISYRDNYHK